MVIVFESFGDRGARMAGLAPHICWSQRFALCRVRGAQRDHPLDYIPERFRFVNGPSDYVRVELAKYGVE